MKLYGSYTSPYVRHCRIILLETGFNCEFIETDQTGSKAKSPTQRVPFLEDDDIFLSDSSAIIKYLREKNGQTFFSSAIELNTFCMVNTAMDSLVNLFFINRDGIAVDQSPYLERQASRIQSTFVELDALSFSLTAPYSDTDLRLACVIGWAKFRNQFDFSGLSNLEKFYERILKYKPFVDTTPPA